MALSSDDHLLTGYVDIPRVGRAEGGRGGHVMHQVSFLGLNPPPPPHCNITHTAACMRAIRRYVYDAIDLFRDAIVCARERDLKSEAVAYSRLGGVYADVLKRPQLGKQQYQRCIEIALALSPGVDHNVDWYKKAWEAVKEQQDRLTRLIEDEWTVEREPFAEEMKPVLDEISKAADGPPKDLLLHVYETHPPKNESHTGPAEYDEDTNYKSLLRRALIHYHFDNNRAKYSDTRWSMICEEISKNLSAQYEEFK